MNDLGPNTFQIRASHNEFGRKNEEASGRSRNVSKGSKQSMSTRSLHSLAQAIPQNNNKIFSTSFHVNKDALENREQREEGNVEEEYMDDNSSRISQGSHLNNAAKFMRGLINRHNREYDEETNPFLGLHHPNHNDVYFGGGKTIFTGKKAKILREMKDMDRGQDTQREEEEPNEAFENNSQFGSPKSRHVNASRATYSVVPINDAGTRWQDRSMKSTATHKTRSTEMNNEKRSQIAEERKDSPQQQQEEDTRIDMKSVDNDKNLPDLAFSAQVFKKLKEADTTKVSKSKKWINYTIPVIDWLIAPVLFVTITLLTAAFIFLFGFGESRFLAFGEVPTYIFVFWILFIFVSFVITHFTVRLIFKFIKGALSFSRVFYFVNSSGYHYSFLLWGILNLVIWNVFFIRRVVDTANFWIVKILTSVIVVGACYIVVVFLSKYVIAWIQREEYWKSLIELMFQERVLSVLTDHPRKRKLTKTNKPSSHGFRSAFKYLKKAYAQEQKNQKERRETRTFEEAIELAQQIFETMDVDKGKEVTYYDFAPFFEDAEAAEKAFDLFDRDKSGGVTVDEMIATIYQIFKNRKTIYKTMDDREDIAQIITRTFRIIFWVIMVFVVLLIFDVSFTNFILPITTLILALSFIFGESLKTLFESFIFIICY